MPDPHITTNHRFTRDLYVLSATFFFVFVGAGAQQAYLVPYLDRTTDWTDVQCSGVVACVYIGMLLCRLGNLRLFPTWSDRRYTILGSLSYLFFTVMMFLVPLFPFYPLATVSALLWGAGAAMMWTGTSMQILHLSDRAGGRHGTGMGILYTSTHAGWLSGALILGLVYRSLETSQLYMMYAVAAGFTLIGNLVACLLPSTGQAVRHPPTLSSILAVARKERALIAGILQFLSALAYGLILGSFTRYVEHTYGADWIWVTVSLYPATRMMLSFVGGAMTDRIGQAAVLLGGFLAGAVGLAVTVFIRSPLSAAFTACTLGLLNSTVPVTASAIVGKAADRERRPLVYGVVFAWRDMGIVIAALGSNILGIKVQMSTVFGIFALVFAGCAILAARLGKYASQRL